MISKLFEETSIVILNDIELPNLVMERDFGFSTVAASVERTIQGKVIITEQVVQGLPFDLVGGDNWGWIDRPTLLTLMNYVNVVNQTMVLEYNQQVYSVRFRYEDGDPIDATPILARPNPDEEDEEGVVTPDDYWYNNVRIKLMKL